MLCCCTSLSSNEIRCRTKLHALPNFLNAPLPLTLIRTLSFTYSIPTDPVNPNSKLNLTDSTNCNHKTAD